MERMNDIMEVYKKCGITTDTDVKVRNTINKGNLGNQLNTRNTTIQKSNNTHTWNNKAIAR